MFVEFTAFILFNEIRLGDLPSVRHPDEQPAMLCTEEEIDAGGKFIKEQLS